jgi:DNA-directed RNA polymerase sigma subunit (sigma70/sigma32)
MLPRMVFDLERVAGLLRILDPVEEKIVRLYFGLGCQRGHAVSEIAAEFGVSRPVTEELLSEAQGKLAQAGLRGEELFAAARANAPVARPRSLRCYHRL